MICHVVVMHFAHLYSMEFQIEAVDGLQAIICLDVLGISQHAYVHCDLEVVLLLANEGIVSQGEVESLVSVNSIGRHWAFDNRGKDCSP